VDGRDGKALGGVGVPFGVVQDLLVGPPTGSLHPSGQPIHHDRLADLGHLLQPLAKLSRLVMKVPSGWQKPRAPSGPSSRSCCRRPRSWRCRPPGRRAGTTARRAARRRRRPGGPPATAAGCRHAWVGAVGAGGPSDRPASQAPWRAARNAGSMTTRGPDLHGRLRHLAHDLVPINVRTHRASRTPSLSSRRFGESRFIRRGWPATTMGGLSAIPGSALCGPAYCQVGERKGEVIRC
jgi:hypothetical protein